MNSGDNVLPSPIQLVVGLGNPGPRYAMTRHNAGFWFVDGLAFHFQQTFRTVVRFLGQECRIEQEEIHCRLFKPTTFMNESGLAVAALFRYYRCAPEQLLVVHDEIDLPPGTIRLKQGGGHGGHNGLRNIIAHTNTRDFNRLRIGVGHPGHRDEVVGYVLHPAPREEQTLIEQAITRAYGVFPTLIEGELARVMNTLHV
uniref:Peptidyl-tRNA hydrolase n=1 Tax=Candidatus Kentrum sp. FM TaxID=2126340 RepID=A0A450T061_9GAMM|nr:MAG: peptidyl-tRNA hydrolase, PTH1 family [Candidatus Kentron sp. FM]VFJ59881.1 MAG: peptidyl-tRNA hydrolase, PTH1 family [Candidatus Kentron sp. FM]VFK11659.1 MAG: peptidyl-tRNA hydrolase, PTH1 family [Candidatus Kentron sp. FM]